MKKIYIKLFFCMLLLFAFNNAKATHNRAGEITYRQIGPLSIEVKITTYTKISGQAIHADRPSLDIHWGDGAVRTIPRDNFVMVHPDIRRNEYIATHTYPGPNPGGQPYIIWMQDPNRNENILNISGGNSVNVEFYLQTEVFLFATSIFGFNSSPILLEPPIDFGVKGQIFMHTPNGYDPDGDSIAYELIIPASDVATPVPGYQPVSDIDPGPLNNYTFNVRTGLFTWNSPQRAGEYNIAILVKSYRNGLYLGGIVRDIQIEIRDAQNTPPQLIVPEEICVEAGSVIDFDVIATDSDIPQQIVTLTATGGPLELLNGPATFATVNGFSPVASRFLWQTNCSHIQQQPYQLVFKARDTYTQNNGNVDASLATFKVVLIKVIGPKIENLQSNVSPGQVKLTWNSPYACTNSPNFLGFTVWRKNSCDPFEADSCEIGLGGRGYTLLNFGNMVTVPVGASYEYSDNTVQPGSIYSYRVLAEFATPLAGTSNYHSPVSGRPSDEKCVQMAQDLPLITNVDVETTDLTTGEILVRWARPRAGELDTLINIPPYRFELFRSDDMTGSNFLLNPIWSSPVYSSYSDMSDTTDYLDSGLNSKEKPYSYRVAFFANIDTLGFTSLASSVFLEVASSDQTNLLTWSHNVPWTNTKYVVFLETPTGSGSFTSLDTVYTLSYSHNNLNNQETYCYYIESTGSYGLPDILDPLINKSQIACGTPLDTMPPCPPIAVASVSGCENILDDSDKEDRGLCEGDIREQNMMFNEIRWKKPTDSCGLDIAGYRLYFQPFCTGPFEMVMEFANLDDTLYLHQPNSGNLAGCYYVTAVDSIEGNAGGNESAPSAIVQTDNCPFYELPNVFTPNGDGANDFFKPCLPYRFISSVDFRVFNRWGQQVFQTSNPDIQWDGTDQKTGKLLAEDVYFYVCTVNQSCIECTVLEPLKGNIHVIHGGR
jgi:gliding motility-associated-like protein